MCETKNNEWKRHILSILNDIDNCIKTTRINPNFASLNKVKTAGSQYLYGFPFSVLANDCSFLWQLEF